MEKQRTYIAIDLKSFYASAECVDRGLDPLVANLVVADTSRTDKTICLAVSPSLKEYGIPGRARLFEVVQRVRQINAERKRRAGITEFAGKSIDANELRQHPYINYYQARAIVDYRRQHGPLKSLKELSLLPDFPDEAIRRLEPYVCYE
jgi:nucleotidyltransferase/DNA polymerase involved in DNA repair